MLIILPFSKPNIAKLKTQSYCKKFISWQIAPVLVSKQQPEGIRGFADTEGIIGLTIKFIILEFLGFSKISGKSKLTK
jgi:hypothetical protein